MKKSLLLSISMIGWCSAPLQADFFDDYKKCACIAVVSVVTLHLINKILTLRYQRDYWWHKIERIESPFLLKKLNNIGVSESPPIYIRTCDKEKLFNWLHELILCKLRVKWLVRQRSLDEQEKYDKELNKQYIVRKLHDQCSLSNIKMYMRLEARPAVRDTVMCMLDKLQSILLVSAESRHWLSPSYRKIAPLNWPFYKLENVQKKPSKKEEEHTGNDYFPDEEWDTLSLDALSQESML